MKKDRIFLLFIILGPIFGCLLTFFWYSGANTFWKSLDYFPFSVQNLIGMSAFGKELWVETDTNEIYKITYPCSEKQNCWKKEDTLPSDLSNGDYIDKTGTFISYKVSSNMCENNRFVYPLFHNIKICITTEAFAPDAIWVTSLALTDDGELWIWDKPWMSPYTEMIWMLSFTCLGLIIGFLAGTLLLKKTNLKES